MSCIVKHFMCFVCETAHQPNLTQLSRLTWQRRLPESDSEDRWQGLTPPRKPPTHTLSHNTQHKNFPGTSWLVSQSNNESCLASSPTNWLCANLGDGILSQTTLSQQVKPQPLLCFSDCSPSKILVSTAASHIDSTLTSLRQLVLLKKTWSHGSWHIKPALLIKDPNSFTGIIFLNAYPELCYRGFCCTCLKSSFEIW